MHEIEAFDSLTIHGIDHPPLLWLAQSSHAAAIVVAIASATGLLSHCRDADEVQQLASYTLRRAAERGVQLDLLESAMGAAVAFQRQRAFLSN